MDDTSKKLELDLNIMPVKTRKAFVFLSSQLWVGESRWYLAGGTALALQGCHRKSVDLDFFTTQKDFESSEFLNTFPENEDWKITINKKNTIYGELFKAKASFIAYPYFVPDQEFIEYGNIKILRPRDIAVMKIIAISQRGRKRDFFDLYWCAKNIELLENLIRRLKKQYPMVAHDYHHILKSMVYFDDAESDPNPEIYFNASWSGVKKFFSKEIPKITKGIMKLE
ncbi:MAG: nucleotidyl transferase AbiEii/AbiGii toxin family protein [bacterium]